MELMPRKTHRDPAVQPLIQRLASGEVLLYDPSSSRVHALNEITAEVYQACDGITPMGQVRAQLGPLSGPLLELALFELKGAGLIEWSAVEGLTRRDLLGKVGKVAAVMPFVLSAAAPRPARAASACEMGGDTGCANAGLFGGANGAPTGPCQACCGAIAAAAPCDVCPTACSADCYCSRVYRCSNDGVNFVDCSLAPNGSICQAGTTDFAAPGFVSQCRQDGSTVLIANSCQTARNQAAAINNFQYRCCECP
ncbi:MAG: hypothetical protein AB7S38_37040 [Vulcanimicrobiota bacterium]